MIRFEWPWALLALPILGVLLWLQRRRRVLPPALRFTKVADALRLPTTRRQRLLDLPSKLRLAALVCLALALAGPQWNPRLLRNLTKTVGIQLLVDLSGSMTHQDMFFEGKLVARLELVRRVSKEFVAGRPNDMIGLIGFAVAPTTLCPLTLDHQYLRPALDGLRIAQDSDGTAIGDAIAVAAARFRRAETTEAVPFKSKVIVLLTDGENNSGARSVAEAAKLARDWGVRVYAIGIRRYGTDLEVTLAELKRLADETGGIAGNVQDATGLRAIYADIDKLEKTDREAPRYTGGRELQYGLAGAALVFLVLEAVLRQTWLRRIP